MGACVPFSAWGKVLSVTGSLASTVGQNNPFRYRGYYYDAETALYYLQSRYYNPEVGRFLNADVMLATGQSIIGSNTYVYCLNNPASMVDSSGYAPVYITDQSAYTIVSLYGQDISLWDLPWGLLGNMHMNGCGVIATYNVLQTGSTSADFGQVYGDLSRRGAALAGGVLGTKPWAVASYLSKSFNSVITTVGNSSASMSYTASKSRAVIVLFLFVDGNGNLGAHYTAGIRSGNSGEFLFYNSGFTVANGVAMTIGEFCSLLRENGCTPVYLIGLNHKLHSFGSGNGPGRRMMTQ